jgi:uncharacterized membrane protein HdeD (DUF308 family)
MSIQSPVSLLRPPAEEMQALRNYWVWFLILGAALVFAGTFAIGWACIVTITVAATWVFGFLLLASGIAQIVNSFWVGRWGGMLAHLLIGVFYTLAGFLIIDQPETAAVSLTLLIAIFLMVGGIFRIVIGVSERFAGWGWVLLNGGVTFLLGLMIYKQWPGSSLWVIGLFVGIDLIFNGLAWIMLSLAVRRMPATA